MQQDEIKMRDDFEKWFLSTQSNVKVKIQKDERGIYRNLMVQIAWRAWKQSAKNTILCNR